MMETLFNLHSKVLSYSLKSTRPEKEEAFNKYFLKSVSSLTLG